jgi:hypothetical protein
MLSMTILSTAFLRLPVLLAEGSTAGTKPVNPGRSQEVTAPLRSAPTTTQATIRHLGDGRYPVGNRRSTNTPVAT